jgi:DNA gyrase subunit A
MSEVIDAPLVNPPLPTPIATVMKTSYLDYAMSVITGRALPDARDGLKPVHRRILYSMNQLRIGPGGAHKKSARVVGDVIGKYHPHGDSAVYEAAARMSQEWVMQHPLIDGQGNFGSIDGDAPAAMRYTEMRLTKASQHCFNDITKNTVDFVPNYDGSESEPQVLPVSFPNLLVNGTDGIAVGMATRVPPHNLREVIDAFNAWVDNPDITTPEIMEIMPAPDFPSGGQIHGLDGYSQAIDTGRGKVKIRARWHEESRRGGTRLVFTDVPYLVNKAVLVANIATLVQDKKIDGIVDLRDESNRKGIRIVIDIKRGYEAELVAMKLIAMTNLETSFSYNIRALVDGAPKQMGFRDIFSVFRDFRIEVIQRRTQYELDKALARLHILEGLLKALDMLDETIKTIRASKTVEDAREGLKALLSIDDTQSQAILDMRLQKLTGLEIEDIREEHAGLVAVVADLRDILASHERQMDIMKTEIMNARDAFGIERRSEVCHSLSAVTREDLIKDEDIVIMGTRNGYIKRIPVASLNRQNRGTKGKSVIDVDDDVITAIHSGTTRESLIVVTDKGQVFAIKSYEIPETSLGGRGRHFRNVFEGMADDSHVVAMLSVKDFEQQDQSLVIATARGYIKRTQLSLFTGAFRRNGVNGLVLEEGDSIVAARISCDETDRVIMVASNARACCFAMGDVRSVGRNSRGVRGIKLEEGEHVLSYGVIPDDKVDDITLLCVGENGVGKKTPVSEFGLKGRGGKGMICFSPNSKTGPLSAAALLDETSDIILMNESGGANRVAGADVPQVGRSAAGSYLMRNGKVKEVLVVPAQEALDSATGADADAETAG